MPASSRAKAKRMQADGTGRDAGRGEARRANIFCEVETATRP